MTGAYLAQATAWLILGALAGWPVRKALRINDRREP